MFVDDEEDFFRRANDEIIKAIVKWAQENGYDLKLNNYGNYSTRAFIKLEEGINEIWYKHLKKVYNLPYGSSWSKPIKIKDKDKYENQITSFYNINYHLLKAYSLN